MSSTASKSELEMLQSQLATANDESSTLSIDLAGIKSKLEMAEKALEESRNQASGYKGELEVARR